MTRRRHRAGPHRHTEHYYPEDDDDAVVSFDPAQLVAALDDPRLDEEARRMVRVLLDASITLPPTLEEP